MGSGLIWAGIGKGISDAGASFGQAMLQEARDKMTLDREKVLEELREKREVDREDRKVAREETEARKRSDQVRQVGETADEMGRTRETEFAARKREAIAKEDVQISGAVSKIQDNNEAAASTPQKRTAGKGNITQAPQASEEELRQLIKNNPQAYDLYEKAGLIDASMMRNPETEARRADPRMQRAQDEYDASLKIGANSAVVESIDKKRQRVIDEIKLENQATKEKNQRDVDNRREDRRSAEFQALLPIRQQQADASTTNSNRPNAGDSSSGDKKDRLTTIINSANQTIKSLSESSKGKTPEEKANWQRQMDEAVALRNDAQTMLRSNLSGRDAAPDTDTKSKSKVKSEISSLPKGAVQVGTSNGKPVYETPDGKRFIAK